MTPGRANLTDDRRLVQRAGLVVPAAVWVLGLVSPPSGGLTLGYVTTYTLLVASTALVDQTAPPVTASRLRGFGWLLVEIVLCGLVVRAQGTLIRPTLIYLLPVGRAILLLGEREGLLASLLVWLAYGMNIAPGAWPDHLGDFPNYLSFFLAPYAVAVVLSLAIVRQERAKHAIQTLYDDLRIAHEELQALHQEVRQAAVAEERNRLAREIHDSLLRVSLRRSGRGLDKLAPPLFNPVAGTARRGSAIAAHWGEVLRGVDESGSASDR